MIGTAVARSIAQLPDPRFRGVLLKGVALTLVVLAGATALAIWLLNLVLPDSVTLPWIGDVAWLDELASGASLIVLLVASIFLMIPVASAAVSLFLDDIADAVEARHHPSLPPAPRLGLGTSIREAAGAAGAVILANLVALVAYLAFAPFAPLIFVALNGWLLGREYFRLVAIRRLGRAGADAAWRRHRTTIWAAGTLMAAPLVVPVLNLVVPILGAATFTHLFHALDRR